MEPLLYISTDFHLKDGNLQEVIDAHDKIIKQAKEDEVYNHIWAGDIFDSRQSQRESVLLALNTIIGMYDTAKMRVFCIPGNHDKTNYKNYTSFLEPYRHHPSFNLIDDVWRMDFGHVDIVFLPFFDEELWLERFNSEEFQLYRKTAKPKVLISHIAVEGSRNNDGTIVATKIKPAILKDFDKVFLGHYHNYQEVTPKIIHLGSLLQNNYGEDEDKGAWAVYENLDYDLIPLGGKLFKKLRVDLDLLSTEEASAVIEEFVNSTEGCNQRVELWGDKSKIQSFPKEKFEKIGVNIKPKYKEVEIQDFEQAEIKKLSNEGLLNKFSEFCEEKEYPLDEGLEILKKVL